MWDAITYVTSGVTLAAFLAAVAAWVYRNKLLEQERLIRAAPETERAGLVARTLEFFDVDPAKLTRDQQFQLALTQIHQRASRFRITAIVVMMIALLAAGVAVAAIYQSQATDDKRSQSSQEQPSDLSVSGDHPDRVLPLDGHPVRAQGSRPVYTGGARVALTLSHNKQGKHPIIIWGLKLELVKYDPQKLPALAYAASAEKIIGKGHLEPRRFRVALDGPHVQPATWIESKDRVLRARSGNFLDTETQRKLTVRSNDDDVEEIDCTVLARRTGLYEARFQLLYHVNGVDRQKYSEPFLIYCEE
jgi:hypothetical protein